MSRNIKRHISGVIYISDKRHMAGRTGDVGV